MSGVSKKNGKNLAVLLYFTIRYRDYALSLLYISKIDEFDVRIYRIIFEMKETTDAVMYVMPVSYLHLHLVIDSEGRLRTKLHDNIDDFDFPIVRFSFICSNIPAAPAYNIYFSQLI